jgi:exodeoxyribonuclease V alpha subunit
MSDSLNQSATGEVDLFGLIEESEAQAKQKIVKEAIGERLSGEVVSVTNFGGADKAYALDVLLANGETCRVIAPWVNQQPPLVGMLVEAHGIRADKDLGGGKSQVRATGMGIERPKTTAGIVRWIKSKAVKGVGEDSILKLAAAHPDDLASLMDDPAKLIAAGMPEHKAEKIAEAWNDVSLSVIGDNVIYLMGLGIPELGNGSAQKIARYYGAGLLQQLENDPWALATSVGGVGFYTADKIARQAGVPLDNPGRVRAALLHSLRDCCENRGHTAPPKKTILIETATLLAGGTAALKDMKQRRPLEFEKLFQPIYQQFNALVEEGKLELAEKMVMTKVGQGSAKMEIEQKIEVVSLPYVADVERELAGMISASADHRKRVRFELSKSPVLREIAAKHKSSSLDLAVTALIQQVSGGLTNADGAPITPTPEQQAAAKAALLNSLSILTGGPGRGKTTAIQLIAACFRQVHGAETRIMACSPTANAAERMADVLKDVLVGAEAEEPRTIHALLRMDPASGRCFYNEHNPLDCDLLILDEASMMDQDIGAALFRAIDFSRTTVVEVGDFRQLASVGKGRVFYDQIHAKINGQPIIPTTYLTVPQRTKNGPGINWAATEIENGRVPRIAGDAAKTWNAEIDRYAAADRVGYAFLPKPKPSNSDPFEADAANVEFQKQIIDLVTRDLPARGFNPIDDVQVMSPSYKGIVGVDALNAALQVKLNPPVIGAPIARNADGYFAIGDKVMHTEKNDRARGLVNGKMGRVVSIIDAKGPENGKPADWCQRATTVHTGEGKGVVVDFGGKLVRYAPSDLFNLALGYCATVHKMQGGEKMACVTVVDPSHRMLLVRENVYTALTRGKSLSLVVGDQDALFRACNIMEDRQTLLGELIAGTNVTPTPTAESKLGR